MKKKHYDKSIKTCGTFHEYRDYSGMQIAYISENRSACRRKTGTIRADSIARARMMIYDIITGNFFSYPYAYFATFTYAENMQDHLNALRDFRLFLRRLRRTHKCEFLAVAERQQRGAIHFHAVLFDTTDFFGYERQTRFLAKLWHNGFVDADFRSATKTLKGDPVRNLGAYLAKYLGQDYLVQFGQNFFIASRGLERPKKECGMEMKNPLHWGKLGDIVERHEARTARGKLIITKTRICSKLKASSSA